MSRAGPGTTARAVVAAAALCLGGPLAAQEPVRTATGEIVPVSGFTGQMSMVMENSGAEGSAVTEVISFEPWQILGDLFRDDLVFVMRGGPTDWSAEDAAGVAPADCDGQRLLTPEGDDQMRQLGALLAANELVPGAIRVSEWCRTQQTYAAMEKGMLEADANALDGVTAETDSSLNLGEAAGVEGIAAIREAILAWDGGDGNGPLLLVTHFPVIAALTRFNTYEGEMLILDPTRDGRVLGYLRLRSATPDLVRFDPSVVVADPEASAEAPAE